MPRYDPQKHPTPPWTWKDDPTWGAGNGYWQLDGSEGAAGPAGPHTFECVQYTLTKINGRRPHHADSTEFSDLLAELARLNFHQHQCGQCGCGDGQCRECVVIYYGGADPLNQSPFHAAVFDRELCDWGGKLSALGAIVRFQNPADYKRAGETMICWCRDPPGSYVSDVTINRGALTAAQAAANEATSAVVASFREWLRGLWERVRAFFARLFE